MEKYPIISLSLGNEYRFYHVSDIMYCKSEGNYSQIYFVNGKSSTSAKKLKDLEKILPNNLYIRVHHSYIVNLMYVSKFYNEDVKEIEMTNGERVLVSRRKKVLFMSKFLKL
ncbi:MAG: LytTR family DNA-binding domain-containing protein [Saprospiraceae bacterium]|nr:LytTR family DNA-binding domain-containing protein [Saprospiraceae bacterium]